MRRVLKDGLRNPSRYGVIMVSSVFGHTKSDSDHLKCTDTRKMKDFAAPYAGKVLADSSGWICSQFPWDTDIFADCSPTSYSKVRGQQADNDFYGRYHP